MLIFSILVFENLQIFKVLSERFDLDTNHRVSKSPGEKHGVTFSFTPNNSISKCLPI